MEKPKKAEAKAVHFAADGNIICGVKKGSTAKGEEVVTCKRCLGLIKDRGNKTPTSEPTLKVEPSSQVSAKEPDPNVIHFSDGVDPVCGAPQEANAVKEENKVTCAACQTFLQRQAVTKGDPLVKVRIKNQDLNDGVDYAFTFQGKGYRLINNVVHMLPRSVCKHLELLAYPFKRYQSSEEPGRAMQIAGKRYRFSITYL